MLAAAVMLAPAAVFGVTIYRFGGRDLPPPPEANRTGVAFVQMSWADLKSSAGGEGTRVQMDEQTIRAQEYSGRYNNVAPAAPTVPHALRTLFDRTREPFWTSDPYLCGDQVALPCDGEYGRKGTIDIALDDPVFIEGIRIVCAEANPLGIVKKVGIHLSPEPFASALGTAPRRPFAVEIHDNRQAVLDLEIPSYQRSAAVQLALGQHSEPWQIAEVLILARGSANTASYVSDIVDFGRPGIWGELKLSLRQEPGARLFLQTRSGLEGSLLRYWKYTGIGDQTVEVSEAEYQQLHFGEQAGITNNYETWTPWSALHDLTDGQGEVMLYAEPRRFFQFRLDFLAAAERSNEVESMEFRASIPAATQIVGEVYPFQAPAGQTMPFTYFLKPRLSKEDRGFDRLEVNASAARLDSVQGVRVNGIDRAFGVEAMSPHRLVVLLPNRIARLDSDVLVELSFTAQVLRYGAAFQAQVSDRRYPLEVPQRVLPGNAIDEKVGDRVWVETLVRASAFFDAQVQPGTFTPNGDGINDQTRLVCDLFEITGRVPVELEIRDLAGRGVRALYNGEEGIGRYECLWDGRDDAGRLVPPGVYLYRVSVDIAEGQAPRVGTVRVAY